MFTKQMAGLIAGACLYTLASPAVALPINLSFSGTFLQDDDVHFFGFSTTETLNVSFRTFSFAGGVQSNGNVVQAGGFDPILSVFASNGALLGYQDDDWNDGTCDGNDDMGICWDSYFSLEIPAGYYIVAISQYFNFAAGSHLSHGFSRAGWGNFTWEFGCDNGAFCAATGDSRTNAFAFDVTFAEDVPPTEPDVPEPASLALAALGAAGFLSRRRQRQLT